MAFASIVETQIPWWAPPLISIAPLVIVWLWRWYHGPEIKLDLWGPRVKKNTPPPNWNSHLKDPWSHKFITDPECKKLLKEFNEKTDEHDPLNP